MQKSFKLIVTFLIGLTLGVTASAQEQVEYKDVILDEKPAKLNVATGEITLVTNEDKVVETKKDAVETTSILVSETNEDGANIPEVDTISDFHSVKDGETLLDVSKKYKVTLTELKQANNLETTLISKGQKLRIKNFDNEKRSSLTTDNSLEVNNSNFHLVEKGNTLFSLAKHYHLSVEELKNLNNLNSNDISIGQKLRVKPFESVQKINNDSVYVVKKGDNLYRIALKHGTTVEALMERNGLDSNNIQIGQKLQIK